jgi:hypothetical protein
VLTNAAMCASAGKTCALASGSSGVAKQSCMYGKSSSKKHVTYFDVAHVVYIDQARAMSKQQ